VALGQPTYIVHGTRASPSAVAVAPRITPPALACSGETQSKGRGCSPAIGLPEAGRSAGGSGDALFKNDSKKALIAFISTRDGGNPEIYVMGADGRKQTRLTNDMNYDQTPAWSPDRARIVFASWPDGNPDANIFVMNADGTGRVQLTSDPTFEANPDWSPDGSKIAFDRNGEIMVMKAEGSNQTPVAHTVNDNDWDPDWEVPGVRHESGRERPDCYLWSRPCHVAGVVPGRRQDRVRELCQRELGHLCHECRWQRTDSPDNRPRT
jgi:hypothetical protein